MLIRNFSKRILFGKIHGEEIPEYQIGTNMLVQAMSGGCRSCQYPYHCEILKQPTHQLSPKTMPGIVLTDAQFF